MPDLRKFQALARNWDALGDLDPCYGVLSEQSRKDGRWDREEFFASGRAHVQQLLQTLRDARATFTPGRCLDFGCGVGRLTLPLAELFEQTIGVDVAEAMIAEARRNAASAALRCELVVNRDPHLHRFADATFDVVHSSLVLQHIPPDIAIAYVAEFFRVCRPGGLVVFQLPADARTPEQTLASYALPASAYRAELAILDAPADVAASAFHTVRVRVTNRGDVPWRHDIPAGRHICVGNHWLHDSGTRAADDDARALLSGPLGPGETVEIALTVQAPEAPGRYILEVDLVQEHVSWFEARGSRTARAAIAVTRPTGDPGRDAAREAARDGAPASAPDGAPDGAPANARGSAPDDAALAVVALPPPARASETAAAVRGRSSSPARALFRRLRHRLRGATPTFEMHVVPRAVVEQTVRQHGGCLVRALDDNAAGPGWLSYTYICRKC